MADKHSASQRLAEIRSEIDRVDQELLRLFNARAALSVEVGQIKSKDHDLVFKPLRERELLDKLARQNPGPLPEEHLRAIWREILSSSRALQRPQTIAYLGPEGTFSYFAAREQLGHAAIFRPCRDIGEIFEEVSEGTSELGLVPLENSLQGTVGVSFDLFLKHEVRIEAELFSRISHCLLSNAGSLAKISKIYSHPQPLAQCGIWLRTHLPNAALIPVESTAAAAIRAAKDPEAAAIGDSRLGDIASLAILARRIENEPGNWTRFVLVAKGAGIKKSHAQTAQAARGKADKSSILFTLPDKPGSLSDVLKLLAKAKVNMRKLESRPMHGQPWKYVFFADVETDLNAPRHAKLLESLADACQSFQILGCYPSAPPLEQPGFEDADDDASAKQSPQEMN